ncbi:fumarylacetoacetate hydrolase family protein [Pseudomonas aeruginosa]|nr:fumarylacetoacetate hydrolase family protein [Pseudomonas aeruginosa]
MRLARVAAAGEAFWALLAPDLRHLQRIREPFSVWAPALGQAGKACLGLDDEFLALSACRLLPPLEPGARAFGVGLNYRSHLERLGSAAPAHPLAYLKPDSALVGADDEIAYPAMTEQLDYEVELVAVLARPLGDELRAASCVLGYTVGNDISARDAGRRIARLDLLTQKAMDRTTPVGPWIVTPDELGGEGQPELDMRLKVNGQLRQQDNSREMIFPVDELLNYLDARISLRPGDLVFTGSTHGVGLEDGRFLMPGDRVEAHIDGLGTLGNRIGPRRVLSPARARGRLGRPTGE